MSNKKELEELLTLKSQLQNNLRLIGNKKRLAEQELSDEKSKMNEVMNKIHALRGSKFSGITISEHAVLRYLERLTGIDTDMIREAIIPEEGMELLKSFNFMDGTFPMGTHSIVLKEKTVVTVIPN